MIDVRLDSSVQVPLYKQIAEQVKQLIAANRLQPGAHLPTVRQLAQTLNINPGTVVRAYLELEQERIVVSRRGAGTVVSDRVKDPALTRLHQRHLSSIVSTGILDALSLGYSPDELEAAFHLHLSRWREERRAEDISKQAGKTDSGNTLRIVGSHDLALNLLVGQLKSGHPEINVDVTPAGSLGGLIALQEERADMAGIHLLDEESGEYNYPYVKHVLPGREMAIVHLAYRIQGLMFARDNPKRIGSLEDLRRPDITFINRQKGSGTRVLLDLELRRHGILPLQVRGYEREVDTHMAVALSISRGEADVGLGIEAAARAGDIGFTPLFRERYDLVIPGPKYRSELLTPLLEIIRSEEFKNVVTSAGGYDTSQTGSTTFIK